MYIRFSREPEQIANAYVWPYLYAFISYLSNLSKIYKPKICRAGGRLETQGGVTVPLESEDSLEAGFLLP